MKTFSRIFGRQSKSTSFGKRNMEKADVDVAEALRGEPQILRLADGSLRMTFVAGRSKTQEEKGAPDAEWVPPGVTGLESLLQIVAGVDCGGDAAVAAHD
jgi:hypothetical protein